ncbi:hypothetical protein [Shewanella sp.]|uniref:hypothetical protein n=1 Tax=Shewanella sp. TaxID=50422 RepID=UPI003569C536
MKTLILFAAIAATAAVTFPANASAMEVMTVVYRSPLDYALYQQKAEMLGVFHAEHGESIRIDAHEQLNEMANAFNAMFSLAQAPISSDLSLATKPIRLMTAPQ